MKTTINMLALCLMSLGFLCGCSSGKDSNAGYEKPLSMPCDSTLENWELVEWPSDSMIFLAPEYPYDDALTILKGKGEANFPWLKNGMALDTFSDQYTACYKEGAILRETCKYVLIWVHQPGMSLSLHLCKLSEYCEFLGAEILSKTLFIPGLKVMRSSILKSNGELISHDISIAIEVDPSLANVPNDTIQEVREAKITCE